MLPIKRLLGLVKEFNELYDTSDIVAINYNEVIITQAAFVEINDSESLRWNPLSNGGFHATVTIKHTLFTAFFPSCDEIREAGLEPPAWWIDPLLPSEKE